MVILTSNVASVASFKKEGIYPIGIMRNKPRYYMDANYDAFSIPANIEELFLTEKNNWEQTINLYKRYLMQIPKAEFDKWLKRATSHLKNPTGVAFTCMCARDNKECHRHAFAEWLNWMGYQVEEYEPKKLKEKRRKEELKLAMEKSQLKIF